ncbi:MAG: RIP metalloprotease RseP [Legionella sp.]|nr:RIP metalloprotease RseP [Legionella sp.]
MLFTLFYFLLALLLLVTVHEYGHFIVARCCGVKVLRFSFGFGKVLTRWQDKKGTEFVWSLIPLGGYVKMLDSEEAPVPPEEQHLAFNHQTPWVRAAIVAAGPVFNFLFAWLALSLALMIGVRSLAPIIDAVQPGSLAEKVGLTHHEEIVRINNTKIQNWQDFQFAMLPLIGSKATATLYVKSLNTKGEKRYLLPLEKWQIDSEQPNLFNSLGITPFVPSLPPIIGEVVPDAPAALGGLQKGDKITAINGQKFIDWFTLTQHVKTHPNQRLIISYVRNKMPAQTQINIGSQNKEGRSEGFIGVRSQVPDWPKEWFRTQKLSPFNASKSAFFQTVDLIRLTFKLMGHFVTGELGLNNLSGPVGIAHEAGESARGGVTYYLAFLALVSVSLGVLNLLPIPLLDGGHLFYCVWEIICRRPVSGRMKLVSSYLGFVFLMGLMVLALSNDFVRLIR